MEKKFKYDAFISYRHAELDKFVAENLHRELEGFRLPKTLAKKRPGQKNRIERVFRDKEELPLTSNLNDPIMAALHDSEYLIVICSPRLKDSMWCRKEIETFMALRGREYIMAVLVEGEPIESFPKELLYRIEQKEGPDGSIEEIKIPVEHFAADVRAKNKREVKKLIPREVQRLCAGMFHLDFDDIRQRHREQKMRRILKLSLFAGIAFMILGICSTITAVHIHKQNIKLEAQSAEIQLQAEQIMEQNRELALRQALSLAELSEQYLEEGDRQEAIAAAVESLSTSDGIELPHTPEGQYILNESIRAYDIGVTAKSEYQVEVAGCIKKMVKSPNGEIIAILDETGTITLFDLEQKEITAIIASALYELKSKECFTFLGNDRFAYIDSDYRVCILDLETKSLIRELSVGTACALESDAEGKFLGVKQTNETCVIIDGSTYEELGVTTEYNEEIYLREFYLSQDGILALVYCQGEGVLSVAEPEQYQLQFVALNTMEIISSTDLEYKCVEDVECKDGIAYVALGKYAESFSYADAYAMAIDMQSGDILWETVREDYWVDQIVLPINENATDLLLINTQSISAINMETGEVSFSEVISDEVLDVLVYPDRNEYLLFLANGEMNYVRRDIEMVIDVSHRFECRSLSNSFICNTPSGIAVAEFGDNKIVVYTCKQGPDVVESEGEVTLPEVGNVYTDEEMKEIAHAYGMEDADYMKTIYYSPDEKYCFITYRDYHFVIYDVETKRIVHTIESAFETELCLGTDEEGNTYLAGKYGIYVLNNEMKPLMWIEHGVNVDMEKKIVYLNWMDSNYEAPLYNVEDLLEIAEHYNK